MSYLNPEIPLEKQLASQIYDALQGDVVRYILQNAEQGPDDVGWRSCLEGHSMRVDDVMLADLNRLCQEVQDRLGFKEKVDYYVTGSAEINAFSLGFGGEGHPHMINVYSSLFEIMDQDELRFIIGHELGHIINRDTDLDRLIRFVYPPSFTNIPMTLQFKIHLREQLAELVADRYGFLACGNLDACVRAFYKMASGLDLAKMHVTMDQLLQKNAQHLDYFLHGGGLSDNVHPVNPIRVQALHLYATAKNEEELDKGMAELIQILLRIGNSPIDEPMSVFIATAGLVVANLDGEITDQEIDHIISTLSGSRIFPKRFLEDVAHANVEELFSKSAQTILQYNPGLRGALLEYMIGVVLADRDIHENEVNFIYSVGKEMGLSMQETSHIFAGMIQRNYTPSMQAIS